MPVSRRTLIVSGIAMAGVVAGLAAYTHLRPASNPVPPGEVAVQNALRAGKPTVASSVPTPARRAALLLVAGALPGAAGLWWIAQGTGIVA